MKRLVAILISCLAFLNGSGDVLIWQVVDVLERTVQEEIQVKDSNGNIVFEDDGITPKTTTIDRREVIGYPNVNGTLMKDFLSMNSCDDDTHWPVARVKVTGNSLPEPIYLNTYLDAYTKWPGSEGMYLGDVVFEKTGEVVGWGNPWTQSEIPSELGQEILFAIEIGEITWDEVEDTVAFKLLAESDTYTREQIR